MASLSFAFYWKRLFFHDFGLQTNHCRRLVIVFIFVWDLTISTLVLDTLRRVSQKSGYITSSDLGKMDNPSFATKTWIDYVAPRTLVGDPITFLGRSIFWGVDLAGGGRGLPGLLQTKREHFNRQTRRPKWPHGRDLYDGVRPAR